MIRQSPIKRRRLKPRRGRRVDKKYLAWMGKQPCIVSGRRATVHHVRRFGEPKDDRRTVPLAPEYHMHDFGATSVEKLGKTTFQELHGVDLEKSIIRHNERYRRETGL